MPATSADVTALTEVLREVVQLAGGDLIRTDLGSYLDFSDGRGDFERSHILATRLLAADLTTLSASQVSNLSSYAVTLRDYLKLIAEFKPAAGTDPLSQRSALLNSVRSAYDSLANTAGPALAIASRTDLDLATVRAEADSQLADFRRTASEARAELDRSMEQARQLVAGLQSASGMGGVARHESLFDKEAERHRASGQGWLRVTILIAVSTLVYAGIELWNAPGLDQFATTGQSIQLALAKLLVFTVLLSALIWCSRIYRAHEHNRILNRHRQIALTTFETFANASPDPETKSSVLLQATEAVFRPQPTGHSSQEPESTGTSQILEIVRNFGRS